MSELETITTQELLLRREAWRKTVAAARAMGAIESQVGYSRELYGKAREMAGAVLIATPCMFRCGRSVTTEFRIDDPYNGTPNTAVCGTCSANIDAKVVELTARH
jgi:hypothetical protein